MGDKEPLVSVIVPVYNVEPYLCQCLESVIGQTYRNLEILIIDDGSTDGCGKICDEYAERDERIRVFHTENRGLSAARNLGLDIVRGDYISFIDSDDWLELSAYEVLIQTVADTGADILCLRCIIEHKNYSRKEYVFKTRILYGNEIINEYCNGDTIGTSVWNKLYRADMFSEIRFPEGRYYEDFATTYQLLIKASKLVCVPYNLIHYRVRKNSITKCHDLKNLEDYWWARHKCYEDLGSVSEKLGNSQLCYCIEAIGRMWRWYPSLPKKEKKNAKGTLISMQKFSYDHRRIVLGRQDISLLNKLLCICSTTRSLFIMWILYAFTLLFRCLKNDENNMFT